MSLIALMAAVCYGLLFLCLGKCVFFTVMNLFNVNYAQYRQYIITVCGS